MSIGDKVRMRHLIPKKPKSSIDEEVKTSINIKSKYHLSFFTKSPKVLIKIILGR